MESVVVSTRSEDESLDLARLFASCLEVGDVVALVGTLGAGKTVFVRGICAGLEVPRGAGVCSPTYALVNLYEGGHYPIAHMDLYRLSDEDELEAIGFRDFLWPEGLVLMEWADRIPSAQAAANWAVEISDEGPEQRRLCFRSSPQRLTVLQSRFEARQER